MIQPMEEKETADLADKEVDMLQVQLGSMKKKLREEGDLAERARLAKEKAESISIELALIEEKINSARAKRAAIAKAADLARDKVMEVLQQVADVDEIEGLRRGMQRDWRQLKSVNRDRFSEKQDRLREIRDDLEKVNVVSRALNQAISANYNRPDRDEDDLKIELEFEIEP
ncbi:hypothetical protein NBRC116589_43610 [Ruegeria sp. HU-ET01832]